MPFKVVEELDFEAYKTFFFFSLWELCIMNIGWWEDLFLVNEVYILTKLLLYGLVVEVYILIKFCSFLEQLHFLSTLLN